MAIKQVFNPLSGNFDEVSEITLGTTNGLSLSGQALSLAAATSSTPGAVANIGAANGVATLDSSGLIPLTQIPPSALERLVIVASQAARFALTTATVQNGDTVKQTDTATMYFVIDDTNLGNSAGYSIYTAGTAASVAWSGITGVPAPVTALLGTNTGDVSLTAVGAVPSANGASLSGQALTLQPADATHPGVLTTAAQVIGGAKTFSAQVTNVAGGYVVTDSTTKTGNVIAPTNYSSTTNTHTLPDGTGTLIDTATYASVGNKDFIAGSVTIGAPSAGYVTFGLGTSSPGVNSNLVFANTANRTYTFTDASTTIVGTDTTQTLSNKTLTTPNIGAATGTSLSVSGQLTSTVATGTAPLVVTSTTQVANLKASTAALADTVTTNANLTGDVTSSGNATTYAGTVPLNRGGTGQTTKAPAFDALSPMTTGGDIIYGGASGTGTRLANGSSGQMLTSSGTTVAPTWTTPFANPMTTGGDVIYGGASGVATRLANGTSGQFLKSNGTTTAPSWSSGSFTPVVPTIQAFLSGSGTYTTPTSPAPLYITVEVAGGGGGGVGGAAAGSTGVASTFGTSLLTANPGVGAPDIGGGAGGTATVTTSGTVLKLIAVSGGSGGPSGNNAAGSTPGGDGGNNSLGGGGGGGKSSGAGLVGATNTGGGGGGGGSTSTATANGGAGGGAGGYLKALITSPSATYAYAVGGGGAGGGASGAGSAGGAGGSGIIVVTEFYQ